MPCRPCLWTSIPSLVKLNRVTFSSTVVLHVLLGCWFRRSQRKRSHIVLSVSCPAVCDFSAKDFHEENSLWSLARSAASGYICSLNPSWAMFNKICFSTLGRISVRLRLVEVWVSLCTPFPAPTCRKCRSSQKMLTTRRTWHGWFSHLWTKPPLWTSLSLSLPHRGKPLSYQVSAFVPLLFCYEIARKELTFQGASSTHCVMGALLATSILAIGGQENLLI